LAIFAITSLSAQDQFSEKDNSDRVRGTRFIPCPNYTGKPYLNDKFILGEIELTDGKKIENIGLSYCTYRDELIYYNTTISVQIQIDKISLKGFSILDSNGKKRIFRRQYFDGSFHGECYFELLSEGKTELLAYRKVNLETCNTYYSKSGLAYQPSFAFYMYAQGKGYSPINLTRNSLLSKFDKPTQKLIRKLLRKNGIFIADEESFISAWNLVTESGFTPSFN
jgi:hypothetical protein